MIESWVSDWAHGWAASRGVGPVTPVPGGQRIEVGLSGHVARYVLPAADPAALRAIDTSPVEPGTWVKVSAPAAEVRASLGPRWAEAELCHLMSTTLTADVPPAPAGYRVHLEPAGAVTVARVLDASGELAASGQVAGTRRNVVFDQIVTEPAHQRRGLGSLVMASLARHAMERGAVGGVLGATGDGRALYLRLGWRVRAPLCAFVRA
ncbi:GNAT family N-acetyltransferase [Longispora sp. NPDC051575]|uniref:GNAT family N-acetyltransferase n=1 Tax=Longispora sp. NPDC051575 TaxID=3154943 RepID=UPI00342C795F